MSSRRWRPSPPRRHVVCEKPLALTADESRELVKLAAQSGLVNATNFNIRFYPVNQQARGVSVDRPSPSSHPVAMEVDR